MIYSHVLRFGVVSAMLAVALAAGAHGEETTDTSSWNNPLVKQGRLGTPLVETTPFVFHDKFYLLENWRSGWDWPDQPSRGQATQNDEMWIAHLPDGPTGYDKRKYVAKAMAHRTLGTAIVWENRVYVFCVNETSQRKQVDMAWSDNLVDWSEPVKVFDSPSARIFNVAITRDEDGFAFLWETNGEGVPFTMCYGRIQKLTDNWNAGVIKDAIYGQDKYTGGPALYYEDGWYYTLYLESLGGKSYETHITRSRDLVHWQDAPRDRPFISFDRNHQRIPLLKPEVRESNTSDAELTYYQGKVIVYFTGSDQSTAGDLQWASFDGTRQELFEHFFVGVELLPSKVGEPRRDRGKLQAP